MNFKKYIPILIFSISAILVLKVALKSSFNAHPDEDSHFLVAEFYKAYSYIPAINDTKADFTYNEVFGRSYINLLGLEYIFMGKFFGLMNFLPIDDYKIVRLFNFFLFLLLGFYLFLKQDFKIFKFSLLLTPQLLYVASYINNDFFAFFMGSVVLIQIISPFSFLNKYIKSGRYSNGLFLLFPVSLFLLVISKYNYIPLILAIVFFLIYKYRNNLSRLSIVLLLSFSLVGFRVAYDFHLNGLNKSELIEKKADSLGKEGYRPQDKNKIFNRIDLFVNLKDRGTKLHELITLFYWHKSSFQSFFGKYGYMTINSEAWTYDIYLFFSFMLFSFPFFKLKDKFNFVNLTKIIIGLGLVFLMLSLSLAHSWVNDFQPQGKYLFPIIGILFLLYHSLKIHGKSLYVLLVAMNIFTVYSYYTNCVIVFTR